jgi:hypothetical protein
MVVYRRVGAAVFYAVLALAAVAGAVAIAVLGEGRPAGVWFVIMLAVALLAVTAGVLPKFVVGDAYVEVHNMVTRYVIPYPAILRCAVSNHGVAVRLANGKRDVPVVALGHSTIDNMLTGNDVAERAVADVNRRMLDGWGGDDTTIVRHFKIVELVAVGAVAVVAVVVLAVL